MCAWCHHSCIWKHTPRASAVCVSKCGLRHACPEHEGVLCSVSGGRQLTVTWQQTVRQRGFQGAGRRKQAFRPRGSDVRVVSSYVCLSSQELSDTTIYEPYTRALLGTASHFCEVVVLKSIPPAVVLVCAIISICMRRRRQQMQMVQMHQVPPHTLFFYICFQQGFKLE